jgi:uncharacterized damage-inducible protein DinB
MLEFFLKLMAHEHWANRELLTALKALPVVPPRTRELVRHLFAAHMLWDKRFRGEAIRQFEAFPDLSLDECAALNETFAEKWRRYLPTLPQPLEAQTISFTGLDGNRYTYRIVDLLTQLHAHSVHHRAQIVVDMRKAGLEPVATDYIIFCLKTDQREDS